MYGEPHKITVGKRFAARKPKGKYHGGSHIGSTWGIGRIQNVWIAEKSCTRSEPCYRTLKLCSRVKLVRPLPANFIIRTGVADRSRVNFQKDIIVYKNSGTFAYTLNGKGNVILRSVVLRSRGPAVYTGFRIAGLFNDPSPPETVQRILPGL